MQHWDISANLHQIQLIQRKDTFMVPFRQKKTEYHVIYGHVQCYIYFSQGTQCTEKSIRCIILKNASNYILMLCFCMQIYVKIMAL